MLIKLLLIRKLPSNNDDGKFRVKASWQTNQKIEDEQGFIPSQARLNHRKGSTIYS